ncbi:hypothetical protein V8E54_012887 [Elaphomyces granulatus]
MSTPSTRSSTPCAVINPPADIQATRKRLFMIESPLTLSMEQYKEYWPFVDCGQFLDNQQQKDIRERPCRVLVVPILEDRDKKSHTETATSIATAWNMLICAKKNSAVRRDGGCEVGKGYRAGQVRANLNTAQPALLEETGASYLSAQDLRNAGAKRRNENNTDAPRLAADKSWDTQRDQAENWLLNNDYVAKRISAIRECDGEPSERLVFALPDRLQVLADRGMLSLMDATHDSNKLKWLLYTIMKQDSDIVVVGLREIHGFCRDRWTPKWILTDDSAGEQSAARKAFKDAPQFPCQSTCFACHMLTALWTRKTEAGCKYSIGKAIETAKDEATKA